MKLISPTKVEIQNSLIHGWGVFATSFIFKGEIIEECPVYKLHGTTDYRPGPLDPYKFIYPCNSGTNLTEYVIAFGLGSLYNHSNTPNVFWINHNDNDRVYQFISLRDIYPNEELFVYYGNADYFKKIGYEPK